MTLKLEPALLAITTTAGTIEVRGPFAPPAGVMHGVSVQDPGKLRIAGDPTDNATATYLDTSGVEHAWTVSSEVGPTLFEEVTYQIWADGNEHAPVIYHRDPLFAKNITHRPERRSAAGTFNLHRQVGLLPFDVSFGPSRLQIELEVVPTKIDYATDYHALVAAVAGGARGLALAYMRSTYTGGQHNEEAATDIEWLTTLRQELQSLKQALHHINTQPHRHLFREVRPTPNYKVRRLDSAVRRAVTRCKGSGPVDEIPGLGPVRRTIDSVNAVTTLDTPEHRWLHMQVRQLHLELQAIASVLQSEARRSIGRTTDRRRSELEEVIHVSQALERLLDLEVLRQAQGMPQASAPSLTMIAAPGYRDAYRILTELRLGLNVAGDALGLQTKDIHDLYELWAFIEVVRHVARYTLTAPDPATLISHYRGGLRIDLKAGKLSEVPLAGDFRSFTVSYNRVYPGQTGDQKPDIVIRVREDGHPDLIVVLDAKYRVDATEDYRNRYGAPGPPIDAINALHRYRDAIVTEKPTPVRPVVRCAALFPLTMAETKHFETESQLYRSLDRLGIGALPFLPGNTSLAAGWLDRLLGLPNNELAWNGVPGPEAMAVGL